MIAILSPAKNMVIPKNYPCATTKPIFLEDTKRIARVLKAMSPWELESLMKMSPELGEKAAYHLQNLNLKEKGTPAILTYDGIVYKYLDGSSLTKEKMEVAGATLRIISGFYGLLSPLDGIMAYRLEMATKLGVEGHKNLYEFWGDRLYQVLYKQSDVIVNLASEEYAKCVRRYLKPGQAFVDVSFKVNKNGRLRTITTYAKMARGLMARYIVDNDLQSPEDLKAFDGLGFVFQPNASTAQKYCFVQP